MTSNNHRAPDQPLVSGDWSQFKPHRHIMAQDLDTIRGDLESRCRLIEMFNMQITLEVEGGRK